MVHALEEIQRLLRPGGKLIDIHPVLESPLVKVCLGGRMRFAAPSRDHDDEDVRQADEALAETVRRRLFVVERRGEFDFLVYGSSVAELRDFMAQANAYDERPDDEVVAARKAELYRRVEGVMQAAGEGAEVVYHERGRVARLRPMR